MQTNWDRLSEVSRLVFSLRGKSTAAVKIAYSKRLERTEGGEDEGLPPPGRVIGWEEIIWLIASVCATSQAENLFYPPINCLANKQQMAYWLKRRNQRRAVVVVTRGRFKKKCKTVSSLCCKQMSRKKNNQKKAKTRWRAIYRKC